MSQCPKDLDAFKASVPLIVRGAIGCFNGFFKQDGKDIQLDPDCESGAIGVILKEWDQQRVMVLRDKWKKISRALTERQVSRVTLSLESKPQLPAEHIAQTKTIQPSETIRSSADLKNDLKLIGLAQASMEFNIPRSTLSRDAQKAPGEPGFLASIKSGHLRFFYREDLRKRARSREGYRRNDKKRF